MAVVGPFLPLGVDPHHDGTILKPALDVASGQVLHRDTFSQYGALSTWLQAAALRLFGPRLLVLKELAAIFYGLAAGVFLLAWRRFLPPAIGLAAAALWLVMLPFHDLVWVFPPWPNAPAMFFQAVALFLGLVAVDRPRGAWLPALGAGAAAALALWSKLPVGAPLALALAVGLFVLPRLFRPGGGWGWSGAAAVAGSFVSVNLAFLALLARQGALLPWWRQTVEWPARWARLYGGPQAGLLSYLFVRPGAGILFLGVVLLFAALLRERRDPDDGERERPGRRGLLVAATLLWLAWSLFARPGVAEIPGGWATGFYGVILLGLAGLAFRGWTRPDETRWRDDPQGAPFALAALVALSSWLSYFPVFCNRHQFWALAPGVGVFVAVLDRWTGRSTRRTIALLSLLLLPPAFYALSDARQALATPMERLDEVPPLEGMWAPPEEARPIRETWRAVRAEMRRVGERPIVTAGTDALWGTFTQDLRNPGPFHVIWTWMKAPEIAADRKAFVEREHPLVIVEGGLRANVAELLRQERYEKVFATSSPKAGAIALWSPGPGR